MANSDQVEAARPTKIPYWRLITDQGVVTPEIVEYPYPGSGTELDPHIVDWIPNDPRNPMLFNSRLKWAYTITVAFATLGISFASSAYAGSTVEIVTYFNVSEEVATVGVAVFVLGFAVGPLIWAPASEVMGRQAVFFFTYFALAVFCAGAAGSQNIWTLIVLRFFAGSFGSSPFTNAGGTIADIFDASERGLATTLFAGAPFLGPCLGPIIGGFLSENAGWRWVQGFLAIFSGCIWLVACLLVPETYAPLLLRSRAKRLSKMSGKVYKSKLELQRGKVTIGTAMTTALSRPWIFLFTEPIVLLLSVYQAIVYGTLYMLFSAFPIVYQEQRHWSEGIGNLPFLGVVVGCLAAVGANLYDNRRYVLVHEQHRGFAPPEARLPPAMYGAIVVPVGLFWFAWTNGTNVHWIVSVIATAPFAFGMVLVFLGIMNYLIDSYTIYAASVLAAASIIRSCFGAAFPLFAPYMYRNLGVHWASCIPAFLSLACVPFPYIFYKYGSQIRTRCTYAGESAEFMRKLAESTLNPNQVDEKLDEAIAAAGPDEAIPDGQDLGIVPTRQSLARTETNASTISKATLERTGTAYQGNPYDIDRVNTRHSAISRRSRSQSTKRRRKIFGA